MLLGVDYYPEQWPEDMIEEDLDNIVELGCNVIRIGEFGWTIMEPEEGKYDFSYFDKVIEKAKAKGLKVIFGTPTATMPAWLAKKYPEVLSEYEGGKKRAFGGRRQYCFNSKRYYAYSGEIIKALADHYKDESAISAWQMDNEFGHEGSDLCYCENCQKAFRNYLEEKYQGNIDLLNHTYGTVFWSQGYSSFEEIVLPTETITTHNPSLRLDWERFRSKSVTDYAKFQYELLKEMMPEAVIIHDFPGGGMQKHYDMSQTAQYMDYVAYNNYPVWGGQKEPIKPHEIAFGLDYMRGLKEQNFWITEAIMGAQGHDVTGYLPRPNQAKLWAYQGMAHGCEHMMFFRYRGATKGAEQFCYGIIDADNVKRRKYEEVKSFFADIKQYEKVLTMPIKNDVCMIYDYDAMAAFRIQRQSILIDYESELKKLYQPFFEENVGVDIIASDKDFSGYKVVIVPLMIVWKQAFKERLEAYVAKGGTVIFTYRTAVKDQDNNLSLGEMLPVGYTDLVGAYVVETESLQETDTLPLKGVNKWQGAEGVAGIFRDMLEVTTAQPLLKYADAFYQDFSALTENSYGKGKVYYIASSLSQDLLKKLMLQVMEEKQIAGCFLLEGVERVTRKAGDETYEMILNHHGTSVQVGEEVLAPYECKIRRI